MNESGSAREGASTPTFGEALAVWAKIGFLSFGGPAGQIALMHRMAVQERQWLDERQYLHALNFCMLLPGPEAMQLATYAGWRLHGIKGGLAAGLLFVLPGALVVLALSAIYFTYGQAAIVEALFLGVKAAVLAIVVEALLRVARRALEGTAEWGIAAAAFVAIFFLALPFPAIIAGAALAGLAFARRTPADLPAADARGPATAARTLGTIATWLAVWVVPLLLVAALFGSQHVLTQAGVFFSILAVVTFGGAYAVLAYMAQEAVESHGWLTAGEMLDGLGLAETTPGPLILVTEFVGFLAGARFGEGSPYLFGLLGAAVALWATFAPCFLWIFTGAPYIERLSANRRLTNALTGVTAAVVGVIFNLALWFGLHVIFATVTDIQVGPLRLWTPELATFDWASAVLALVAAALLLGLHQGVIRTLAACAALGLVWRLML